MPDIGDRGSVREIDVIAIDAEAATSVYELASVPSTLIGTWTGDQVGEVLDLIAALPTAEQARCYFPRYAVRLRAGAAVQAVVPFCYRCSTAMVFPGPGSGQPPSRFGFDPQSAPARELLRRFRTFGVQDVP